MAAGGRSPEELETLLEDALLLRDGIALARLFEADGVLVIQQAGVEARGSDAIAHSICDVVRSAGSCFAGSGRVVQGGDIALLVGEGAINVARRGQDRCWKVAVSWLAAAQ